MSGSSRSLIKALDSVFLEWNDADPPTQLSPTVTEVVVSFHAKHNTLQTLKSTTSINDELFRIYNTYIKPDSKLSKESVFLVVLRQLSWALTKKEIHLWLKTYLKPAIDSAGFDLGFVAKARDFIRSLLAESSDSDDPQLKERMLEIESSVGDILLEVYLGVTEDARSNWLRLYPDELEKSTQLHQERIRYIKHNSCLLIEEYGQKKPQNYFRLLEKHFVEPKARLETSVLISSFASSIHPQAHVIVSSPLLDSICKCLLFDFNHSILRVTLSILTMLIPQIRDFTKLLPEILLVMFRLLLWDESNPKNTKQVDLVSEYITSNEINWKILYEDSNVVDKNLTGLLELIQSVDYLHYGTLLYGLFPLHFKRLTLDPLKSCLENRSQIVGSAYLNFMGLASDSSKTLARKKLRTLLLELKLHPKFVELEGFETSGEMENPFEWIRNALGKEGQGWPTPEEISIECLNLHPDLMVDVGETMLHSLSARSLDKNKLLDSLSGSFETVGRANNNSQTELLHLSRHSSVGSPVYFQVKDSLSNKVLLQQSFQNLNRKMSIIPTNMVVEGPNQLQDEIKFKDVKFDQGSRTQKESTNSFLSSSEKLELSDIDNSQRRSSSDYQISNNSAEPLFSKQDAFTELMSNHETLFGPKSQATSIMAPQRSEDINFGNKRSTSFLNEKLRSDLLYAKQPSVPTTSLETTIAHKASIISSGGSANSAAETQTLTGSIGPQHNDKGNGSALDFYQRELLLVKNEYEFASFIKHMNKFRYIKLKLQMSKMKNDKDFRDNRKVDMIDIDSDSNEIVTYLKNLTAELKSENMQMKSNLISKLTVLRSDNEILVQQLDEIRQEKVYLSEKLSQATGCLPEKEHELAQLKLRISELECDLEKHSAQAGPEPASSAVVQSNDLLTADEEHNYKLTTEINHHREKNSKLTLELEELQEKYDTAIKNHEKKLSASKLDLNENISSFTSQYEKKIQELSTTLLKYEALLDEKNAKLIQVLSSKPISIPSTPDQYRANNGGKIPLRSSRTSTADFDMVFDHHHRSNSSLDGLRVSPQTPIPPATVTPSFQPQGASKSSTATSSVQPVPIIRGRGGYQKRSKKLM